MLHRRAFCKALATAPAAMAAPMLMRSAFADEVSSIVMVSQHGLPYLPLMVMEDKKLLEKEAKAASRETISAPTPPRVGPAINCPVLF